MFDSEAEPLCVLVDELFDLRIFDFHGVSARLANQKNAGVIVVWMDASDISIAALDARCDALFAEKIERSVNTRRGDLATGRSRELIAQIIGAKGPLRRPERC